MAFLSHYYTMIFRNVYIKMMKNRRKNVQMLHALRLSVFNKS